MMSQVCKLTYTAACLMMLGASAARQEASDADGAVNQWSFRGTDESTFSLLQRQALASGSMLTSNSELGSDNPPALHEVPLGTSLHDYLALETSDMHMNLSNLVHSNLGGHGPDGGAPEMRYQNVYPLTGASVDLVVRAVSPYQPANTANNGLSGTIGSMSMRGGRSTTFSFSFWDTYNHSKPVTIGQLYFSYFDIDGDKKGLKEEVSTPNYEKVYLSEDTSVQVIEGDGPGIPTRFRSTAVDNKGKNNPDDPSSLTAKQRSHSVTFSFVSVSKFNVTLATPNGKFKSGRNFMFNGVPLFPKCVNTTATSGLTFDGVAYSNFGNYGPDYDAPEGMRLTDVFEFENGQTIDLIVTSVDGNGYEYVPKKTDKNGVVNGFGSINMEVGSKAKFKFEFVDSETNASVILRNLVFSWLDLDGHPSMENFQEAIIMGGFQDMYLADDSEISVTNASAGKTRFASTKVDSNGGKNNPTDPTVLTLEQERRAFSVKFDDVSTFEAVIDLSSGSRSMPRSLFFHGVTRLNNAEEEEYCK